MPETIRLNAKDRSIELQSSGVVTQEDIDASMSRVRRILKETGINKIIVDATRQENMFSTMCIFEHFKSASPTYKVSLLIQDSQTTTKDFSIAENVGLKRGVLIKIFHDKAHALQWLDH